MCSPGRTRASEMTSLLLYSASPGTPGTRSSVFRSQAVLPPTYRGARAAADRRLSGSCLHWAHDWTRRGTSADWPPPTPRRAREERARPPVEKMLPRRTGATTADPRRALPPPKLCLPEATAQPLEGRGSFGPHDATVPPQEAAPLASRATEGRPALSPHGLRSEAPAGWRSRRRLAQAESNDTGTAGRRQRPRARLQPTLSPHRLTQPCRAWKPRAPPPQCPGGKTTASRPAAE